MIYIGNVVCTSKWGYILIDKSLFENRRNKLLKDKNIWAKPPYAYPHISIFTTDELKNVDYSKVPQEIDFRLTGEIKTVKPKTWENIYECIIEIVQCKKIEEIRKQFNLNPLIKNNHEFHLTLGVKSLLL
jgi:hypothetical protein